MKRQYMAILMAAMMTGLSTQALAEEAKDVKKEEGSSDQLDLKKLEDKYWASKDSDFSVVQNRTYTKDHRPFLTLSYGTLVNDPYSTGRMMNIAAGYYLSERWGVELAHMTGAISDSDATADYKNRNKVSPDYNTFKSYTAVNAIWVPFYAKMSFLDTKIVYFDIQFAAGVGTKSYQSQHYNSDSPLRSAFAYNFDFTQQLFFNDHFAIRLDLKNQYSKQDRDRSSLLSGQTEADRSLGSTLVNDSVFLLGFTYFH